MNMQDELLKIWQERGTTMVMVTHDVDEAIYLSGQDLCDVGPSGQDREHHRGWHRPSP
jgi:ABC-type nitrate/sulfonate/bicarbonate transport system ATPase subunit